MNDLQHTAQIDSQEQQGQTAEYRRFRAFTTPGVCGGAGLSEAEAERLITILETQRTE